MKVEKMTLKELEELPGQALQMGDDEISRLKKKQAKDWFEQLGIALAEQSSSALRRAAVKLREVGEPLHTLYLVLWPGEGELEFYTEKPQPGQRGGGFYSQAVPGFAKLAPWCAKLKLSIEDAAQDILGYSARYTQGLGGSFNEVLQKPFAIEGFLGDGTAIPDIYLLEASETETAAMALPPLPTGLPLGRGDNPELLRFVMQKLGQFAPDDEDLHKTIAELDEFEGCQIGYIGRNALSIDLIRSDAEHWSGRHYVSLSSHLTEDDNMDISVDSERSHTLPLPLEGKAFVYQVAQAMFFAALDKKK